MGIDDYAEALARQASQESGLDDRPNADPAIMAVAYCGLELVPHASKAARLVEGRLYYPRGAPPQERAFLQAHELGHDLIRAAKWTLPPALEEAAASRVGCSLLLPARAFLRDVRTAGGDVRELAEMWPLASAWVIARRMCELIDGVSAAQYTAAGKCRRRHGLAPSFAEAVDVGGLLIAVSRAA